MDQTKGLVSHIAYSPSGKAIAWATSKAPGIIHLHDAMLKKELKQFKGHAGGVNAFLFSLDGSRLFSSVGDDTIRGWVVKSGKQLWKVKADGGAKEFSEEDVPRGALSLALSPNGRQLASGNFNGQIHIWNLADQKRMLKLRGHGRKVTGLAFSPDGKSVASGSFDRSVRIWNLKTGDEQFPAEGSTGYRSRLTVAPNGLWLATAGDDGTVRIWSTKDWRLKSTLTSFEKKWIAAIEFSVSPA